MIITTLFIALMIIFTISDLTDRTIPNWVVLPAIVIGCFLTKNLVPALIMLLIGIALFGFEWKCPSCGHTEKHKTPLSFWRGGDVKLITMTGAFMGALALPITISSIMGVYLYRRIKNTHGGLPYAPFLLVSSAISIGTIGVLNWLA